jgi:hypothetical protein
VPLSKGGPTVQFTKQVENICAFHWPYADEICELEAENTLTLLPESVKKRRDGVIFPLSFGGHHAC